MSSSATATTRHCRRSTTPSAFGVTRSSMIPTSASDRPCEPHRWLAMDPSHIHRYQVIDRIGRGGMGSVYLARDPIIRRLLAVKLLREEFDVDERRRFEQEALVAGRLEHVNIVLIYDAGVHEGRPFIAMRFVPGETLSELIARRAPLSLARKLQIVEELC